MKLGVFIHTNERQYLGALVSAHSMRRNSRHADELDIRIVHVKDHPFLAAKEGQLFLRGGLKRPWRMDDLQSFTPLRFMPPELMGYEGRAVIVDPDIFAVGDIHALLTRDMGGKAIMCRQKQGKTRPEDGYATSCMLLDCAKLTHWKCAEQFDSLFRFELDYVDWIELHTEPPESIGLFEPEWNDFDHLDEKTKLIHNTKRHTQPWKSGLPVDFVEADKFRWFPPRGWVQRARRQFLGDYGTSGTYKQHPDPNQEALFFGLLKDAMDHGVVSRAMVEAEMKQDHIRHDALEVMARVPPLDEQRYGRLPIAA